MNITAMIIFLQYKLRMYIWTYYVLKKYSVSFIPIFNDKGCLRIRSYLSGYKEYSVHVNPFSENFIEIFLHELGHYVRYRKTITHLTNDSLNLSEKLLDKRKGSGDYKLLTYNDTGDDAIFVIYEEARASKFARRAGKRFNINTEYLKKAFLTYSTKFSIFFCYRYTDADIKLKCNDYIIKLINMIEPVDSLYKKR